MIMEKKQIDNISNEDDNKKICGIVMPISEISGCSQQHWKEVKNILEESIREAKFEPNLVSDADDIGIIQSRIVQNIYQNEMVVCDVSCKNPNVMFELGLRLAFDKPTIIIIDDKTTYSFDTAPIEHISYPRDLNYSAIIDFKAKLSQKIVATYNTFQSDTASTFLQHFGEFKLAKIESKEGNINDVILDKFEGISKQIRMIYKAIYSSQEDIYSKEQINKVVDEGIQQYCELTNKSYNDFLFLSDQSPEIKALYAYLKDKVYVLEVCKTPQVLKNAMQEVLFPF
jgi:hypothetical protein